VMLFTRTRRTPILPRRTPLWTRWMTSVTKMTRTMRNRSLAWQKYGCCVFGAHSLTPTHTAFSSLLLHRRMQCYHCQYCMSSLNSFTRLYIGPSLSRSFMDTFTNTIIIKRLRGEVAIVVLHRSCCCWFCRRSTEYLARFHSQKLTVAPI